MSEIWLWFSVGILAVILLLLAVVVILMKRGKIKRETDYRTFFIMGVIWFPLGIALDMPFFYILGLAYIAMGLANRNKWKEPKPLEGRRKMLVFAMVGILVLAVILTILLKEGIFVL